MCYTHTVYRERGGLGFSTQQCHSKASLTFPLQQFGSIGKPKCLQINPKFFQQVVMKF